MIREFLQGMCISKCSDRNYGPKPLRHLYVSISILKSILSLIANEGVVQLICQLMEVDNGNFLLTMLLGFSFA